MTITLEPETEARLRERAARDGKDVETLANALLADRLQDDEAAKEEALRSGTAGGRPDHSHPAAA